MAPSKGAFFKIMLKKILRVFLVGIYLFFAWPFFLYKVFGNRKYKLTGNTIIIANHYSNFDPFFIYLYYFKYHIRFVTIIDVKKKILPRFIAWLFDCFYVTYDGINLSFMKKAIKHLKNNGILCIFPEGEINPTKYGFFEFYESYIRLAKKCDSSILPLYIYPVLKPFKKSKLYIGDIILTDEINSYKDNISLNMHIQSLIMNYSLTFDDN